MLVLSIYWGRENGQPVPDTIMLGMSISDVKGW